MALQTPRQRSNLQRPSFGNPNSSPSGLNVSTAVNRKASLQALTGQRDPRTPATNTASSMDELAVGDVVSVPGDMYGTVKFVGSVRGKNGKFVGVELHRTFAVRGKNDGDVDGTHYFTTSVPGAGIFLPAHRAERRASPAVSLDSFPPTPNTPSHSTANGHRLTSAITPPTPALPSKFSQSVGPAARPPSPQFKPKRPSLPRPESPLRKAPVLTPAPARTLSQSQRGPRPGLATTTPSSKNVLRSSTATPRPTTSHRAESRQGLRSDEIGLASSVNGRTTSSGSIPSFSQPLRPSSRLGSAGGAESEVARLRAELAERDKRLNDQAANLADMEVSVKELSGLISPEGLPTPGGNEDQSASQLRQMLREKNEKITLLTSEFDQHRADFRSTLDSLEMASTETERVYEEQKRDLLAQVASLQDRIAELEELNSSKKDFEDVARQLKGLEDFVQELEEGLEDARRGEAEARGEVEFLRGEVERGRSELKREREKAAAAATGTASPKELGQRDDEIRGLKAIIQSMSTGTSRPSSTNSTFVASAAPGLAEQLQSLQSSLDQSQQEKERLEKALEQLRRDTATTNGHQRNESERTATTRSRSNTVKATFAEHARRAAAGATDELAPAVPQHGGSGSSAAPPPLPSHLLPRTQALYCDMCESREHDTLDCGQFQKGGDVSPSRDDTSFGAPSTIFEDRTEPAGGKENVTPPSVTNASLAHGNQPAKGVKENREEDKWCALCEKDGHLAYECPDEQY